MFLLSYVFEIFPHIKNPSERLEKIAKNIWELFNYGYVTNVDSEVQEFFGLIMNATEKARKKIIDQMKLRVETIKTYNISDETIILKMLLIHPYAEIMPKINGTQLKMLRILCKHPSLPISLISKKMKKSQKWVKKNMTYLTNKHLIGFHSYVDVTAFGLKPVFFLFYVYNDAKEFFRKVLKNPFLVNLMEIELIIKTVDFTPYFVVFHIPQQPKVQRLFQDWLRTLLYEQIIKKDFYRFEPKGLVYTINIQMFDGINWFFDLRKDVLSQFFFTSQVYELLPLNANLNIKYTFKKMEHITSLDLYVASFFELNARMKKTEIFNELKKLGLPFSKKAVFKSFQKIKPFLYPSLHLFYGLKDSFYAFIELNYLKAKEEIDFLLRYFSNALPLSYQYFCDNGLIVIGSYPPELSSQIYSVFSFLNEYYEDMDLYTNLIIYGKKMLRDLIPYWDEKKQYWIAEEEMFQPYIVREEEQKDVYRK